MTKGQIGLGVLAYAYVALSLPQAGLGQTYIPADSSVIPLVGFDSAKQQVLGTACVSINGVPVDGLTWYADDPVKLEAEEIKREVVADGSVKLTRSNGQILPASVNEDVNIYYGSSAESFWSTSNLTLQAAGSYGSVSGQANYSTMKSTSNSSFREWVVIRAHIPRWEVFLNTSSGYSWSAAPKPHLAKNGTINDLRSFRDLCGDSFVVGVILGGDFGVTGSFETTSEEERQSVKTFLSSSANFIQGSANASEASYDESLKKISHITSTSHISSQNSGKFVPKTLRVGPRSLSVFAESSQHQPH